MNADDVIRLLALEPHPEGGYFRETFRDANGSDGRARSTAIYYLLKTGESRAGIASMRLRSGTGTRVHRSN